MAITFTQLAAISSSTSNTNSYSGNAGTPAAGDLLLAFVTATDTNAAGTMSGQWAWNKLTSGVWGSLGVHSYYVFWAIATSATSTTPVFDCTGDNATGCLIYVLRVSGHEANKIPFIRQVKSVTGSGANPAITLNAACLTGSGVCGFSGIADNTSGQYTAPSSWSENAETTYSNPSTCMEVASRSSGETGSTITWTNAQTAVWFTAVIELAEAGAVPFFQFEIPKHAPGYKKINDLEIQNLQNTLFVTYPPIVQEDAGLKPNKKKIVTFEPINKVIFNQLIVPRKRDFAPKLRRVKALDSLDIFNNLALIPVATDTPRSQQENPELLRNKKFKFSAEGAYTHFASTQIIVPRKRDLLKVLRKSRIKYSEDFPNLLTSTLSQAAPPEEDNQPGAITFNVWPKRHKELHAIEIQRSLGILTFTPNDPRVNPEALPDRIKRAKARFEDQVINSLALNTAPAFPAIIKEISDWRVYRRRKLESLDIESKPFAIPILPVFGLDNPRLLKAKRFRLETLDKGTNPFEFPVTSLPFIVLENPELLKNKKVKISRDLGTSTPLIPSLIIVPITDYYRHYLNDLETPDAQVTLGVPANTTALESYFRRYLNDVE